MKNLILILILYFSLLNFIKCDSCTIKAICNCQYKNATSSVTTNFLNEKSFSILADELNICTAKIPTTTTTTTTTSKPVNLTSNFASQQFVLNCSHIDLSPNSTDPQPPKNNDSFVLHLQYPCAPKPQESHYSTGTILVIIFITCLFSYLALGIAVNYFLVGARGVEMMPNLDFWKDFPALVLDGVKFVQNGCKARPSDLTAPSGADGYDAI